MKIGVGNKIGIVGCSNGQKRSYAEKIKCRVNGKKESQYDKSNYRNKRYRQNQKAYRDGKRSC